RPGVSTIIAAPGHGSPGRRRTAMVRTYQLGGCEFWFFVKPLFHMDNWTSWPRSLRLLTKPRLDQPDDTKPRHNANSGSALRTGIPRIYLPTPLDAQARAEMQTRLSPRLQSDPLGALYGYAMEVPARAACRRRHRHDPLHDHLQGVRPM